MLAPLFSNSAQLDTFRYGSEDYIVMTFFFHSPQQPSTNILQELRKLITNFKLNPDELIKEIYSLFIPKQNTWRPPIEFMPISTIIMPRKAYKDIVTKFLGHISRQDEPNEKIPPNQIKPEEN